LKSEQDLHTWKINRKIISHKGDEESTLKMSRYEELDLEGWRMAGNEVGHKLLGQEAFVFLSV
jgi:hypothetical protein